MTNKLKKEIKKLIEKLNLNCSIKKFKDKVKWNYISYEQELFEDFIKEFKDKVNWNFISFSQTLSEDFIKEFKDKVEWYYISGYQTLSEDFIREFKDKVIWYYISKYQTLSEDFIREFKDKIDIKLYNKVHKKLTKEQKLKEVIKYAEKHNLKLDKNYLYAFRNHDKNGKGMFSKNVSYKKDNYYKDWHLDMRKNIKNSFGLGIWAEGNTPIKVKIEDWGVEVDREDGKARVWGFEII